MNSVPIADAWERGNPYDQYIGRWSRQVAPAFLDWLDMQHGQRWLDVGCGTGALAAAIMDEYLPSSLVGVDPSAGFLEAAARNLGGQARLYRGDASSIPLPDACVDVVVSGLMLNFVPDLPSALAEMRRVATPGATVSAYVWDYAGKMELLRYFWDAAVELDPQARTLHEGARFQLCNRAALDAAFCDAGLLDVATCAIDIPTTFKDFAEYWSPFCGGQGPAPSYAMSLSPKERELLRNLVQQRLPINADGSIALIARAWAVRGVVSSPAN
jgi:SAM-dependent methyltransferase